MATSQLKEMKTIDEYINALMANGLSVLEGTAPWCDKCKTVEPLFEKLSTKYPNARFYKYDIEASPDIAHELGVHNVPSFVLFKDGGLVEAVSGTDTNMLEDKIKTWYKGKIVEE